MTLQDHFPEIPLEEMLTWACTNGAKALGMDDRYGTLEVGKKPGIAGITACDIQKPALTPEAGQDALPDTIRDFRALCLAHSTGLKRLLIHQDKVTV